MKIRIALGFAIALVAGLTAAAAQQPPAAPAGQAAPPAPPAPPRTPRTIAPIDITGYWVAAHHRRLALAHADAAEGRLRERADQRRRPSRR